MTTTGDQRNEDGRQPLRKEREEPPRTHHSEAPRTKQYLQEGGDTDAVVARTSPRVSPGTRGAVGGGVYPTPFRKVRRHPQASPRRGQKSRQRFLPTQPPPPPPQTNHSAPPIAPPTNMCHHGHRINFVVSLRSPTRDLEDGRRESGLGGICNIADVRGQPPPPPRSRPDARTRGLPSAEARPDPKGSGQPLPSRCSSPADEAATARRPPPPRHQLGSSVATPSRRRQYVCIICLLGCNSYATLI